MGQTGDSPKAQCQYYMGDAPTPQSLVFEGFQQCRQQCEDGRSRTTTRRLPTVVLTVRFELRVLACTACHAASHCSEHCALLNAVLIMFQQ